MELGKRSNFSYLLRNSKPQNIYVGLQPISLIQELWRKQSDLILPLASEFKKKKNPVISKHPNCMEFGAIWGYYQRCIKRNILGTPLAVQWLGLCNSTAGSVGLIPGRATMMPHAMQWHSFKKEGEKKKEKRERNILVWLKFLVKAQLLNIDNKWPCHYCFQISMEHSGL